jgi:beta-glucosidase
MMIEGERFPVNFFWGASTASHQVEGNNCNNWTVWEAKNSQKLAREGDKYSYIPSYSNFAKEISDPDNYISGKACNHFELFRHDFDIAQQIGINSYRFSLEWSRIEPCEGEFNLQVLDYYRQVIRELKLRGIEPFVTLWHWSHPVWLEEQGGWLNSKTSRYFERYAETVVKHLKDDVKYWITLNEPMVYASACYYVGLWPPQVKSFPKTYRVVSNLAASHRSAYRVLRKLSPSSFIGIAKNNLDFQAADRTLRTRVVKYVSDYTWNRMFLQRVKKSLDFIGLNYYFRNIIRRGKLNCNENARLSDLGWELYPEGIYNTLVDLKKYKLPIYVTENGLADRDDLHRGWFIQETVKHLLRAIKDGVDLRGYFHWSLLDNFEWDKGFWPRFGLVGVDYSTFKRNIRPSARAYSEIIRKNGLGSSVV